MVLTSTGPGGLRVAAVDEAAAALGLHADMALAHARALVPHVRCASGDPAGDEAALGRLAEWAICYTPWVAVDGDDGLMLDVTGCAHLFGGEAALIAHMVGRLARAGFTASAAVADTPAAAWAWVRYGAVKNFPADGIVAPRGTRAVAAPLPVAALRSSDATVEALGRLGLHTIGDLLDLPRAPLARRFGPDLSRRLDRLLGREDEPISPLRPTPVWRTHLQFPEPIVHRDGIDIALDRLLARLCELLRAADQGARALTLTLTRVDCTAQHIHIGTSRPVREPRHLMRLFAERLGTVDAGFGIETATLAATRVESLAAIQGDLHEASDEEGAPDTATRERLGALIDRLENRLGPERVRRIAAVESHIPERAAAMVPVRQRAMSPTAWPQQDQRPLTLLPAPEPILVLAPMPDDPPLSFTWRRVVHRVARAHGPERIDPEWWRQAQALPDRKRCRDYYRVEDGEGRRFWIFREGLYGLDVIPRWFMHGMFA